MGKNTNKSTDRVRAWRRRNHSYFLRYQRAHRTKDPDKIKAVRRTLDASPQSYCPECGHPRHPAIVAPRPKQAPIPRRSAHKAAPKAQSKADRASLRAIVAKISL